MRDREGRMPIMAHLEELRKRLLWSAAALFLTFLFCFQYSEYLLKWLQIPLTQTLNFKLTSPYVYMTYVKNPVKLVFLAPAEAFWMYMKIGFIAGIFLALPFLLMQVWLFISPGLKPRERRYALPFIISGTGMFVLGALFCQYVILPFRHAVPADIPDVAAHPDDIRGTLCGLLLQVPAFVRPCL